MIYRISFWNDTQGHESFLGVWDLHREHLTRDDHRRIIARLLMESATGGTYAQDVSACVGMFSEHDPGRFEALPIFYEMHSSSSYYSTKIYDDLYLNGVLIRRMVIAE